MVCWEGLRARVGALVAEFAVLRSELKRPPSPVHRPDSPKGLVVVVVDAVPRPRPAADSQTLVQGAAAVS